MKRCGHCKQYLPEELFNRNRAHSGGLENWCRACKAEAGKEYRSNNKARVKERRRRYYLSNKDKLNAQTMKWQRDNRDKFRTSNRECKRRLLKTTEGRLNNAIRSSLSHSLKRGVKNNRKWSELVDYDIAELRVYLEKRFLPGMDWDNYGEWHVDHIRPISSFSYTHPEDNDFRECWKLANLQPLWAADNLRKHTKYE